LDQKGQSQNEGGPFGKSATSGFYPLEPQGLTFAIFFFCRTARFNTEGGSTAVACDQWLGVRNRRRHGPAERAKSKRGGAVAGKVESGFLSALAARTCDPGIHFPCNKSLYYRGGEYGSDQ
jgi:hypothetical protein